jgi:hypothetical protein
MAENSVVVGLPIRFRPHPESLGNLFDSLSDIGSLSKNSEISRLPDNIKELLAFIFDQPTNQKNLKVPKN